MGDLSQRGWDTLHANCGNALNKHHKGRNKNYKSCSAERWHPVARSSLTFATITVIGIPVSTDQFRLNFKRETWTKAMKRLQARNAATAMATANPSFNVS